MEEPHGFQISNRERIVAILNEPFIQSRRYQLLDKGGTVPETASRIVRIKELGAGGFGVVVRARDHVGIERAVKFYHPEQVGISEHGGPEGPAHKREIRLANAEPFKNVLRIFDLHIGKDIRGERFVAHIMDFVNGLSLDSYLRYAIFANRERIIGRQDLRKLLYGLVFNLLDQAVAATQELHRASIVHMDIKPQNFIVKCGVVSGKEATLPDRQDYELFLTDLGGAKKLGKSKVARERTPLVRTPNYFPDDLLDELDFEEGTIDRRALDKYGKVADLFCLGRMLEELFLNRFQQEHRIEGYQRWRFPALETSERAKREEREASKEGMWRTILGAEFEVVEMVVRDLLKRRVPTAEDLADSLGKISRLRPSDLRASQVLTDIYPGVQIKVSEEVVTVAEPMKHIVDHVAFQRLKKLNQLSLVYETYPGATHTRFAHSLLTFALAKKFLLSLGREAEFRYRFKQKDIDTILCAALLHDLGQYPFAHSIEDLRQTGERLGIDHLRQIKFDQELLTTFAQLDDSKGLTINSWLEELGVDLDDVSKLVDKSGERLESVPMSIGREIINSTIDVDRLSYLRLDSYMTGVPFGRGIDIEGLLDNLIFKVDGYETSLAVEEKGVSAAEMVIAAVYWMYLTVYWHRNNRRIMAALKHVVDAILRENVLTFDEYLDQSMWIGDQPALLLLNELYGETAISAHGNPIEELVNDQRVRYKRVAEIGYIAGRDAQVWEAILGGLTRERLSELYRLVSDILGRDFVANDPAILWDLPMRPRLHSREIGPPRGSEETRTDKGTGMRLWVRLERPAIGPEGRWKRLKDYSGLARAISEEEKRLSRKIRLFVHEEAIHGSRYAERRLELEHEILEQVQALVVSWKTPEQLMPDDRRGPHRAGPPRRSEPGSSEVS